MNSLSNVFLIVLFQCASTKWVPELNFQPDFNQFQIYDSKLLQNVIYSQGNGKIPSRFEWQTVGSVTLSSINESYIIYGGSQQVIRNSSSAFNREISTIILCEIKVSEKSLFYDTKCESLNMKDNNKYLGASIKTLSLSNNEAVVAYCDPLWHKTDKIEPKPSGKCYLLSLNDKKIKETKGIEFCQMSPSSYSTCMGGFSIDLVSMNGLSSGIEMIVGMPYKIPYGEVQIVNDPFGSLKINTPSNGIGKYYNFGYAVSITANSVIYVSSPLSDQYGPNVTEIRENMQIISPDNEPFSSFGVTLATLSIDRGLKHAVVIGAPFHSVKSIQNVGKTYIFCSINNNKKVLSASIYGQDEDEFFGYALANIGDINGDGNDDIAISSPFLRENDARGFISIYVLNDKCGIPSKPHQVLRSSQSNKIGIFGVSLTGGSDLDFNTWPDIVVLSTKSNSIQLYASRQQYIAQCIYSINNNYETQELVKNDIITIKLFLNLLESRKNNLIDLTFLKDYNLISQIDPNFNISSNRFESTSSPITIQFSNPTTINVEFSIKSLQNVKEMNLTNPIIIQYRFIENCTLHKCNDLYFPLIHWEKCLVKIPVKKYICSSSLICNADLAVSLNDELSNEIIFGYDKNYYRSVTMKILNLGPTEAKDINFKISTSQNLRINKISRLDDSNIKDIISPNQTDAVVKFDKLELDVTMSTNKPLMIIIDLYFADIKSENMKYENNSLEIQLFSDVFDSNLTNNIARIDYVFIYETNLLYSGSAQPDTVIDSRNRSQLIIPGQRIALHTIGPRLSQTYVVDNVGTAAITNMIIKISLPIHTSNNLDILYLFDKIRGTNKSRVMWMSIIPMATVGSIKYPCQLPSKYVNPLDIIGFESHEKHLIDIDRTPLDGSLHLIKKRSVDESTLPNSFGTDPELNINQGKVHRSLVEIIKCNRAGVNLHSPVCANITCVIPFIPPNKQARIQINARLMADTFFKKQISDIMIYTTLSTEFGKLPDGIKLRIPKTSSYSQYQQFIFQNVKPKIDHIKASWPIIVGVVIGILILAILIVALYKCGFFERTKRRRHFNSKKYKPNDPVIIHPADFQASTISSEVKFTSHSTLINNKE